MNGPDQYRQAESLLAEAHVQQNDNGPGCGSEELIAEAGVRATLALTAAIVAPHADADWQAVIS